MEKTVLTLLVGCLGGYFGSKTNMPSGVLLGSMFFVGIYNLVGKTGYIPPSFSLVVQILIGSIIGLNFTLENIKSLSQLFFPSVLVVLGMLIMSVVFGVILSKLAGLDLVTSLFATSPGALSAMALLTESYGAKSHVVVLLHTFRLVSVITFMPLIIKGTLRLIKAFA